mgnify:CR=1 FL=1
MRSLWFIGSSRDSFSKRIRADGRCAVGVVDFDLKAGLLKHVGFRGNAVIEKLDPERLKRFLNRYIGKKWEPILGFYYITRIVAKNVNKKNFEIQ